MQGILHFHPTREQAPSRCCGCIPQRGSTLLAAFAPLLVSDDDFEALSLALLPKKVCRPCMGPDQDTHMSGMQNTGNTDNIGASAPISNI